MLTRQEFKADWIQINDALYDHLPFPDEIRKTSTGALLIYPSIVEGVVLKYVEEPLISVLRRFTSQGVMFEVENSSKFRRVNG